MEGVWEKVKFKGVGGEVVEEAFFNSGSDYVVLTREIAERIKPKNLKIKAVFETAKKSVVFPEDVYEVEIEIEDPETKEKRKEKVKAIVTERDFPLVGLEAMGKFKIILDIPEGKIRFKK